MKKILVWVFDDGRAGTFNQALAVAEALNYDFVVKKIEYNSFAKLPNFIRGASFLGIKKECLKKLLAEPLPDLVITAGRRAAPLARKIRKLSSLKTELVQIMYPGMSGLSDFLLVVVPKHDNLNSLASNMMEIVGAPHRITSEIIADAGKKWQDFFKKYPRPYTALIVGGSTKNRKFTDDMAKELMKEVRGLVSKNYTKEDVGSLLITTSRRTGKSQENIIKQNLTMPAFIYSWGDKGENPYFAFLALADKIVVTGDSVSMVSEAISASPSVYVYDNPNLLTKKHQRFLQNAYELGYAYPLSQEVALHKLPFKQALNPAVEIAEKIRGLLEKKYNYPY